jgi:SAM-dependent methyltransferase
MTKDFHLLPESELIALDDVLAMDMEDRWQSFYANRARPCPFFERVPDENLVAWSNEKRFPVGSALDIGCGNARNSVFLAKIGYSVTAIDYSSSAIAWARENVAESMVDVTLEEGSIFDQAQSVARFDFVYDSGCFHHIAPHRRQHYIDTVCAKLKPRGWFGLVCFAPEGGSGFSDSEVYEWQTLGGGLGYTEAQLRNFWSAAMHVRELRRMNDQPSGSGMFGKPYLWVMLAQKR